MQAATRAYNDKRSPKYVCALSRDIGDSLALFNHAEVIAAILRPFIDDRNDFILQRHGVFQGYYFRASSASIGMRATSTRTPLLQQHGRVLREVRQPFLRQELFEPPDRDLPTEVLKAPKQVSVCSAIFAKTN